MKKKFIAFISFCLICSILLIPSTAFAATNDVTPKATSTFTNDGTVTPNIVVTTTYQKTITRYYSSLASVPSTYYYSEFYSPCNAWASGTLSFSSAVASGSGVMVTFSGTMYCVYTI